MNGSVVISDEILARIKVVFMDIGGVLLTNGWGHESREKAAKHFGFDYGEMEALHNFIYNVFEIGSIDLDQYLDTVLFYRDRDFTKSEFKEFMYGCSQELPDVLSWAKQWKKRIGVPVFALNNESRELNDYRIKKFGLHDLFDGFFSSCYVGARKPDPEIYMRAMKIAHVEPEECVYFDDRLLLVKAARSLGIQAIHHEGFERSKEILEGLLRK